MLDNDVKQLVTVIEQSMIFELLARCRWELGPDGNISRIFIRQLNKVIL